MLSLPGETQFLPDAEPPEATDRDELAGFQLSARVLAETAVHKDLLLGKQLGCVSAGQIIDFRKDKVNAVRCRLHSLFLRFRTLKGGNFIQNLAVHGGMANSFQIFNKVSCYSVKTEDISNIVLHKDIPYGVPLQPQRQNGAQKVTVSQFVCKFRVLWGNFHEGNGIRHVIAQ